MMIIQVDQYTVYSIQAMYFHKKKTMDLLECFVILILLDYLNDTAT